MPLKKPQSYFTERENLRKQAALAEERRLIEAQDNKRLRSPKKALGELAGSESVFSNRKPERNIQKVAETIVEKVDTIADFLPEGHAIWDRLSGIENSISTLHIEKLEKHEVLSLYESIEALRDVVEAIEIPEPLVYDDQIDETRQSIQSAVDDTSAQFDTLREEVSTSNKELNDSILSNRTSYEQLLEKVDSFVLPDIKGNSEEINTLRGLHSELKEVVDDLPNQKSRFDPTSILESLSDLRDGLSSRSQQLDEKIDNLPEIRHYEDDLDLLQNFITEVKSSIRYYDADVDDLKSSIMDLGKHLGETINNKVKTLNKTIKSGDKRLHEVVESLPEVKYYDDEIDLIEGKITNLLKTITELPEVKYYDDDVRSLTEAIDKLNAKIDSIDIPDWTDVITNIQGEVASILDTQKDFDKRWEKAAEEKDPLLDPKNFVTFEDMQKHYRTFLERVQIQLGTVGGGGAVEIMEMDDIEDDFRTNPQNYDNYFLQHIYDPETKTSKFTAALNFFADIDDIDLSNALDGNILVWDSSINGLKLVTPQSQGINNDFNPSIDIQDYGQYGS